MPTFVLSPGPVAPLRPGRQFFARLGRVRARLRAMSGQIGSGSHELSDECHKSNSQQSVSLSLLDDSERERSYKSAAGTVRKAHIVTLNRGFSSQKILSNSFDMGSA